MIVDFLEEVRDLMLVGKEPQVEWRYTVAWPPGSFDGILVMQGISHAGDWAREGRELTRLLRAGGAMVLTEIGFTNDFYVRAQADMHLEYYVRKLFEGAGLAWRSLPSWDPAKVRAVLDSLLEDVELLELRGAQLFWGTRPSEPAAVQHGNSKNAG